MGLAVVDVGCWLLAVGCWYLVAFFTTKALRARSFHEVFLQKSALFIERFFQSSLRFLCLLCVFCDLDYWLSVGHSETKEDPNKVQRFSVFY
jgi:hypothetical protein